MSPKKPKRAALYLRVSTSEQTTRNQRRELHAVAERHGWDVVATYEDAGRGAKGRDAITNATGVRVRNYPITLDKLLDRMPEGA